MLERFGRPRGLRASQTALAWLLAKAPSIVPIPGTTKQTHLEENLAAAQRSLSSLEVSELEAAAAEVPILGERYPTLENHRCGQHKRAIYVQNEFWHSALAFNGGRSFFEAKAAICFFMMYL